MDSKTGKVEEKAEGGALDAMLTIQTGFLNSHQPNSLPSEYSKHKRYLLDKTNEIMVF